MNSLGRFLRTFLRTSVLFIWRILSAFLPAWNPLAERTCFSQARSRALFAAGAAPDPQFGRNQLEVYVAATTDTYTYSRKFAAPTACAGGAVCTCPLLS